MPQRSSGGSAAARALKRLLPAWIAVLLLILRCGTYLEDRGAFIDSVLSEGALRNAQLLLHPLGDGDLSTYEASATAYGGRPRRRGVFFLKTHKTGSTTVQNILIRYGVLRNLRFALPRHGESQLGWPAPFRAAAHVLPQRVDRFDMLCHHLVFDEAEARRVMPRERALYVTIVRDAADVFASAYAYYRWEERSGCYGTPLERFRDSTLYRRYRRDGAAAAACGGWASGSTMPARNLMAADLGLAADQMDNETAVRELIARADSAFDLVLVLERLDESLLLLRDALGWTVDDVVAFPQNAARAGAAMLEPESSAAAASGRDTEDHGPADRTEAAADSRGGGGRSTPLGDRLRRDVLDYNRADALIYEHFATRFNRDWDAWLRRQRRRSRRAADGDGAVPRELAELRRRTADWYARCVEKRALADDIQSPHFQPWGWKTEGYALRPQAQDDAACRLLALPELTLTKYLQYRAFFADANSSKPFFPWPDF